MLSRRIVAARPLTRALVPAGARLQQAQFIQKRTALTEAEQAELADPLQNGGYINPPPEKRGKRDPYGDYWDKQERRNYGEPCHEDHDILGVLSLHDYDHFKPAWGFVLLGTFVASVFTLCGVVGVYYPDKKSAARTFPDGLAVELGGKGALLVRTCVHVCLSTANHADRHGSLVRDGRSKPAWDAPCIYNGLALTSPFLSPKLDLCLKVPSCRLRDSDR
jgi:NADH dehydrogenase (ubiquinone) 1 beta subcomplex subunit 8